MTLNEITAILSILTLATIWAYYHTRPKKDFSGLDREEAIRWIVRITFFVVTFMLVFTNVLINFHRLYD
jgi:hypothetical protein